jgi:hypothetical protein
MMIESAVNNMSISCQEHAMEGRVSTAPIEQAKAHCRPEQKSLLREQIGQSFVFTCPFLFVGCKYVAFSSADWAAHTMQHQFA